MRTPDNWRTQAYHAAPLGAKAVEDAVREVAKYEGVEAVEVHVEYPPSRRACKVSISHRDVDAPMGNTLQLTSFAVANYRPEPVTDWQEALAAIKARQDSMPPHLRGYPVDVDEALYRRQLDDIREATGYEVALGDFAMWHTREGGYAFCYITRPGEIAFRKWTEVKKIKVAEPVYDDSVSPEEKPAA